MFIQKDILKAVKACAHDKYRPAFQAVCFDYDESNDKLTLVATDAQVMIVYSLPVKENDKDFYLKWFKGNRAYFIKDEHLPKTNVILFEEKDNKLFANGCAVDEFDGVYPNWQALQPKKGAKMRPALNYCGFNKNLIKIADKAWGFKDENTIMMSRPNVIALDDEDDKLLPHYWQHELDGIKKTLLLMPLRID